MTFLFKSLFFVTMPFKGTQACTLPPCVLSCSCLRPHIDVTYPQFSFHPWLAPMLPRVPFLCLHRSHFYPGRPATAKGGDPYRGITFLVQFALRPACS